MSAARTLFLWPFPVRRGGYCWRVLVLALLGVALHFGIDWVWTGSAAPLWQGFAVLCAAILVDAAAARFRDIGLSAAWSLPWLAALIAADFEQGLSGLDPLAFKPGNGAFAQLGLLALLALIPSDLFSRSDD